MGIVHRLSKSRPYYCKNQIMLALRRLEGCNITMQLSCQLSLTHDNSVSHPAPFHLEQCDGGWEMGSLALLTAWQSLEYTRLISTCHHAGTRCRNRACIAVTD